jgi:hypothetical protein
MRDPSREKEEREKQVGDVSAGSSTKSDSKRKE